MPRSTWEHLPAAVRTAIERQAGPVLDAVLPDAGRNSDFSATLHTATGPVFCKGISEAARGKRGRMHRHEADINPWLPSAVAPRLRWRTEVEGWLLLGFEHVPGRHADLSPGSQDLPLIADTISMMVRDLAGSGADAARLAPQWARFAPWRRLAKDDPADLDEWARDHFDQLTAWEHRAVEVAEGDNLVHTDLHSLNILVSEDRARVIDWAWSRLGSAAVDVAFLVARLVAAGHSPAEAEAWAETIPLWQDTPTEARTALAVQVSGVGSVGTHGPRPTAAAVGRDHTGGAGSGPVPACIG
jgi:hypothetical protein